MKFQPQFRLFSFADFLVDVDKREIHDGQGVPRRLVGKPFDVLVYLAAHDRFVTNAELIDEFWSDSDSGDEEGSDPHNVHKAVSKIRQALGDSSCIVTERNYGIRLRGPVTFPPQAIGPVPVIAPKPGISTPPCERSAVWQRWPWRFLIAVSLVTLLVFLGAVLLPATAPVVVSGTPITHTGSPKYVPVITDGEDLYFTDVTFGQYRIIRLHGASHAVSIVPTTVQNPYLCDLSPDGKSILLRSVVAGFDDYGPLFIQSLKGAPADPLPIIAFDGSWSPDGKTLVSARGPEVALFDIATKVSKIVARVEGYTWWPRWEPGGNRIRFTVTDPKTQLTTIWEVRPDGRRLRQLFEPGDRWFHAGAGSWTTNGRYFLFQVGPLADSKIWVLDEGLLALRRKQNPIQLTFQTSLRGAVLAPDGRTILARSQVYRGELRKVDPVNGNQTEFPTESLSDMAAYSPDGKWMVYCVSDQDESLWLSKTDGTSPRMLVGPPLQSAFPQWSPKGDLIALVTRRSDDPWKVTLVSPQSGKVERLSPISTNALHPSWGPDGTQLMFGTIPTLNENAYLYTMDLATRHTAVVPGSQGLFTPAWSPNGRYIAALKGDSYQIALFDKSTAVWDFVAGSKFGYPVWSPDSRFVYSFHNDVGGPRFYRIDISTKTATEFLYLPGFRLLERWIGLDPEGFLLVAKNIGVQDIYALTLDHVLTNSTPGR